MKEAVKKFVDKYVNLRNVVYAAVALVTIVLFAALLPWAAGRKSGGAIVVVESELRIAEGVRREYLAGETPSSTGLTLVADGKETTEVEIEGDLSSAGVKRLYVSHKDGNTLYRGSFDVTVYAVRHYSVESMRLYIDENGKLNCADEVIRLDLNASPKEFTVENSDMPNVITLDRSLYSISSERDADNADLYTVTFDVGSLSFGYTCVDAGSRILVLDSPRRILKLTNTAGTEETLMLYVTTVERDGGDGEKGAEGVYIYTDADGDREFYEFRYYLSGWDSRFVSQNYNQGFYDRYIGEESADKEGMEAGCNGVTFRAGKIAWHVAVLDRND